MSKLRNTICVKCSSCGYCANRESGVMACINFNKFPKESADERNKNSSNK